LAYLQAVRNRVQRGRDSLRSVRLDGPGNPNPLGVVVGNGTRKMGARSRRHHCPGRSQGRLR
jgi:hypothetical protein